MPTFMATALLSRWTNTFYGF